MADRSIVRALPASDSASPKERETAPSELLRVEVLEELREALREAKASEAKPGR